jgi:hypothetical protein
VFLGAKICRADLFTANLSVVGRFLDAVFDHSAQQDYQRFEGNIKQQYEDLVRELGYHDKLVAAAEGTSLALSQLESGLFADFMQRCRSY